MKQRKARAGGIPRLQYIPEGFPACIFSIKSRAKGFSAGFTSLSENYERLKWNDISEREYHRALLGAARQLPWARNTYFC